MQEIKMSTYWYIFIGVPYSVMKDTEPGLGWRAERRLC